MVKIKTYADIRRESFLEHGKIALAIVDTALAQINETLNDCGLSLGSYNGRHQPEVSLASSGHFDLSSIVVNSPHTNLI